MTKEELQKILLDFWKRAQVDSFAYLALKEAINKLEA